MNIKQAHSTGKTIRVKVEEIWENEYLVEAKDLEEAKDKLENGSLGQDYFSETKRGLPKKFIRFAE